LLRLYVSAKDLRFLENPKNSRKLKKLENLKNPKKSEKSKKFKNRQFLKNAINNTTKDV